MHRVVDGSPGLQKVAQFGDPVGPGTVEGFITDSGLRPMFPAVEIYRVGPAGVGAGPANPGAPYLTPVADLARVVGGPESLLRIDERRRLLRQPPLGPMLLTADAQRAGLHLLKAQGNGAFDHAALNRLAREKQRRRARRAAGARRRARRPR